MRIDEITLYHVQHPLIEPWATAYGSDPSVHSVLVKMRSGHGSAWAESSPLRAPTYSPECAAGVFLVASQFMAPALVGHEVASARELLDRLAGIKGNPFAKAALEISWWMLKAQVDGAPLHRLLGGKPGEVRVGADFGLTEDIEGLLRRIQAAIDLGHERVKLKVKPGHDLHVLRAVRREFPRLVCHIDCNSGYTLKDLELFRRIDELGLAMIEQPLRHDDLIDHARLQKALATPICLDESCNSVASARAAIEIGACRYMNVKPGRVGGLQNAIDIHDLCRAAGIPCWVGGMIESSVGAGICLELATLPNFTYPADIFPSRRFFTEEISARELALSSPGRMRVEDATPWPYVPIEERLQRRTVSTTTVRARGG
jgi:O-succinylbenzoate synthase